VPAERVTKLVPPRASQVDSRFGALDRFEFSPILGIHLWYDRRVLDLPHAALVGSPLHWLFDRGVSERGHQHLHGVISAARDFVDLPSDRIVRRASEAVAGYLPGVRNAALVRGEVIKERRATISLTPGVERIRPGATGPIENLFLAGDYCVTGWPCTMEGAVRSGQLAAEAACRFAQRRAQS
jgi:zeta-carotene desaturase